MVSQYEFLRQSARADDDRPNFILARDNDFESFCERFRPASFANWCTLEDGTMPPQLRLLRFEHLADDVAAFMDEFGLTPTEPLGHHNASKRGPWQEYLTPRAEAAIYASMEFLFDIGQYPRATF